MKLSIRPSTLLSLTALAAIGFGYYHGLRPNDVNEFISSLIDRDSNATDSTITVDFTETKEKREEKIITKTTTVKHQTNVTEKIEKESVELQPLPANPFELIDSHVLKCPESSEKDLKSLKDYFLQVAVSDIEKARAIYIWLTHNIKYDDDAYNTGKYGDYSSLGVLKNRLAVCEGFSNLYLALGQEMGLEIQKVIGYAKGYSYVVGQKFTATNHAWNIIKINGEWRIFDATWGQGNGTNVKGKLVSKVEFNDYWFNVDPYEAIYNHLPENRNLTYINPNIDLLTFEVFPQIHYEYFKLGFNGKETYQSFRANRRLTFPKCYDPSTYVKATVAPKYGVLYLRKSYDFEFYIPRGLRVAIVDGQNNWTYIEGQKGVFKLEYSPKVQGELSICVQFVEDVKSFQPIIVYNVKGMKPSS